MAENIPPASSTDGAASSVPGQPFYEKTRAHLKDLLHKQRILIKALQAQEDAIFKKETEYLEDTPAGNIIVGFESYTKGTAGASGAARRKGMVKEDMRVFSKSSITWGPTGNQDSPFETAQSTPITAMAPTPLSASFARGDGGSNHATPTSATSASNKVAAAVPKKNKKAGGEDEEDERETKKARTTFGVVRK